MDENLKLGVPDDPSVIVGPKILNVGTFCLRCEDSACPEIESRWDGRERLNFGMREDVWNV